jgi:hypothetical protein
VIDAIFPYFVDELIKISTKERTTSDQRRMVRDFAILGATSAPLVSGMLSLIEKGEFTPKGAKPGRWLASRIAGGLIGGAAFPSIRRHLARPRKKRKS